MSSARSEIEALLPGAMTPGLEALGPVELDALARLIVEATQSQESALAAAIDNGLTIVPKLLRGTVRKALFG